MFSNGQRAPIACEDAVEDRLKAPGTAEFVDESQNPSGSGNIYTVTGEVDAENSFGAMIRSSYTCQVEFNDQDQHRILAVTID